MDDAAETVLAIDNLGFRWPDSPPLLSISDFRLERGERVFVHGPSGSGKTTLLSLVAGMELATSGTISILGQSLAELGPGARDRLRGDEIGYVFQQFNLVPYLSVLDNALLPLSFSRARRERMVSTPPAEEARRLLGALGLEEVLYGRLPEALSVGQQQRVAVARALMGSPSLLICDEPTSALDADARDDFMTLLLEQCAASSAALLFVSHDRTLERHFSRTLALGVTASVAAS
ncbi:MAG: ABC transporter ATP-binding protein [Pseudomonadota bacterium]